MGRRRSGGEARLASFLIATLALASPGRAEAPPPGVPFGLEGVAPILAAKHPREIVEAGTPAPEMSDILATLPDRECPDARPSCLYLHTWKARDAFDFEVLGKYLKWTQSPAMAAGILGGVFGTPISAPLGYVGGYLLGEVLLQLDGYDGDRDTASYVRTREVLEGLSLARALRDAEDEVLRTWAHTILRIEADYDRRHWMRDSTLEVCRDCPDREATRDAILDLSGRIRARVGLRSWCERWAEWAEAAQEERDPALCSAITPP